MATRKKPEETVVLVTGTSSGFGRLTAARLHSLGYRVYGTSRYPEKSGVDYPVLKLDVTDRDAIAAMYEELLNKEEGLDVLINNAGMGIGGTVEACAPELTRLQMDTVFWGAVEMTRMALPLMRKQGGGRIIFVSSIAARLGLPLQGYYSAAKFAMEGLAEALSLEVRGFGIDVVLIEPGDMKTGFTAGRKWCEGEDPVYASQIAKTRAIIEKNELTGGDPEQVARKIVQVTGKKHPRFRYMVGKPDEKLAVIMKNFLPYRLFERILALFYGIKL